jgi:hypothetical protein
MNGERGTGNGEWGTENGEWGTENGERGTGKCPSGDKVASQLDKSRYAADKIDKKGIYRAKRIYPFYRPKGI